VSRRLTAGLTGCILTLKTELLPVYNNPVRTSQETHYVTATEPNRLVRFRETVAVYCENHTEHTDTLCGQNAEFCYVKAGGTYSDHWVLKVCYKFSCLIYAAESNMTINRKLAGL
jgi:hypothetical protein